MRSVKGIRREGILATAPTGLELAVPVEDAQAAKLRLGGALHPREEARPIAQLGDVHEVVRADEHFAGADDIGPLGDELAVGVEDLHAAVFAVGHVEALVSVDAEAVGHVEFSGASDGRSP